MQLELLGVFAAWKLRVIPRYQLLNFVSRKILRNKQQCLLTKTQVKSTQSSLNLAQFLGLNILRGLSISGHVVRASRLRHRNELTEKAWENGVTDQATSNRVKIPVAYEWATAENTIKFSNCRLDTVSCKPDAHIILCSVHELHEQWPVSKNRIQSMYRKLELEPVAFSLIKEARPGSVIQKQVKDNADKKERRFGVIFTVFQRAF